MMGFAVSPNPSSALFRAEQAEIDRPAHLEVADRRGMNAIPAIIGRFEEVRIIGAAHDLVEVDHRIKIRPLADPVVHLVSDLCLGVVPAGVPHPRYGAMI